MLCGGYRFECSMLNLHRHRQPRILVSGEVAILFPRGSSRTIANITIVGRNPAVIIDAGQYWDPGASVLTQALLKLGIPWESVTTILITHSHLDHIGGLAAILRKLPNAKAFCHTREIYSTLHHFRAHSAWKDMFQCNNNPPVVHAMYWAFSTVLDLVQLVHSQRAKKISGITDEQIAFPAGNGKLHPIFTPGHSLGHTSYLYDSGDLILGDMVPRTPWLDPIPGGLRRYVQSVNQLLALPIDKVRRSIRSHANAREGGRVFYPWKQERERFSQHLAQIQDTLEKLPRLLMNRELTIPQILPLIIRRNGSYSKLMSDFYIDPDSTWVMAYLEELVHQGKISRKLKRGKIWWSA